MNAAPQPPQNSRPESRYGPDAVRGCITVGRRIAMPASTRAKSSRPMSASWASSTRITGCASLANLPHCFTPHFAVPV